MSNSVHSRPMSLACLATLAMIACQNGGPAPSTVTEPGGSSGNPSLARGNGGDGANSGNGGLGSGGTSNIGGNAAAAAGPSTGGSAGGAAGPGEPLVDCTETPANAAELKSALAKPNAVICLAANTTFDIGANNSIATGITLRGAGSTSVIQGELSATDVANLSITALAVDGDKTRYSSGIHLTRVAKLNLRDVEVRGFKGECLGFVSVSNSAITGVVARDCTDQDIGDNRTGTAVSFGDFTDVTVTKLTIDTTARGGRGLGCGWAEGADGCSHVRTVFDNLQQLGRQNDYRLPWEKGGVATSPELGVELWSLKGHTSVTFKNSHFTQAVSLVSGWGYQTGVALAGRRAGAPQMTMENNSFDLPHEFQYGVEYSDVSIVSRANKFVGSYYSAFLDTASESGKVESDGDSFDSNNADNAHILIGWCEAQPPAITNATLLGVFAGKSVDAFVAILCK